MLQPVIETQQFSLFKVKEVAFLFSELELPRVAGLWRIAYEPRKQRRGHADEACCFVLVEKFLSHALLIELMR